MNVQDILDQIIYSRISTVDERERFKLIESETVPDEVITYLNNKLQQLTIEINKYRGIAGNIMTLMQKGALEGWCWQTTESAILFFENDDYIQRGSLKFNQFKNYYHSWIVFNFEAKPYVFDPCLQIISSLDSYNQIFEVEVKGQVTAKEVRDELIEKVEESGNNNLESLKFMKKYLEGYEPSYYELRDYETKIGGNDDVTSPMYRNNTSYMAEIENGKVKSLIAHYWHNG